MLDDDRVYAKTAKGVAEVGTRSGAVSLAARRVLIMIDGKRSIAELGPLTQATDVGAIVEQLEALGLVQPADGMAATSPPVFAPVVELPEDAEERPPATFEGLKRKTIRELGDRLGTESEVMASRIDQCRTTDELRQRLHEAERLVAGLQGEIKAQDFVRALKRR
jgi:hypothetical protein